MQGAKQLTKALGLDDRIVFKGFQEETYDFLDRSDCFVFSSKFEGFPNVVLEAMACGLPVIATDCASGPREILAPRTPISPLLIDRIEMAEFGILVPVGKPEFMAQAMLEVYQNESLREALRLKAKERAADFDSEKLVCVFDELLSEHAPLHASIFATLMAI